MLFSEPRPVPEASVPWVLTPFLPFALAFALGIWACARLGHSGELSLVLSGVGLVLGWLLFGLRKDTPAAFSVILATVFLGSAAYAIWTQDYEKNALRHLEAHSYVDFIGRLTRSPSKGLDNDSLHLKVERVNAGTREVRAVGHMRLTVAHTPALPKGLSHLAGDRIRVAARMLRPHEYRNFGPPLAANSLRSQNVHVLAFTKSALLIEKLEAKPAFPARRAASRLKQSLQKLIERHFSLPDGTGLSSEGAVLEALLLGERRRMDDAATLALQESGLFHLIAISGAHIGIIAVLFLGFFRWLRVPARPSALALLVFLVFYAVLVEGTPSVLRATIMAAAFLLGKLLWREATLLNALSLSGLALLILNPTHLFDVGFELTYSATLAIIVFAPRISAALGAWPFRLRDLVAVSAAAQLGVLPLLASAFNRVTLAPLALNLLAVPLVAVIMAAGYLFFPLACVLPAAGGVLAAALKFLTSLLLGISSLSETAPLVSYRIPPPPLWVSLGYFLFLFALLLPKRLRFQRTVLASGFSAFVLLLAIHPFSSASQDLRLTFVDVGQGDAVLVEFPGRSKMLIDGGGLPSGSFDMGERVVSPFLWRKGIKRLDHLVSTHAHPDHIGGLPSVAKNFRPREFWEGARPLGNASREALLRRLPSRVKRQRAIQGFHREESGVEIDVLHPPAGPQPAEPADNDRSLVLRFTYGTTSFLLPADIGIEAERQIGGRLSNSESSVLKASHHGSRSSSGPEFLARVAPRVIVIPVGQGNAYGLPHQDVLARYATLGARVYRTDLDGAVEITSDGQTLSVRTAAAGTRERHRP